MLTSKIILYSSLPPSEQRSQMLKAQPLEQDCLVQTQALSHNTSVTLASGFCAFSYKAGIILQKYLSHREQINSHLLTASNRAYVFAMVMITNQTFLRLSSVPLEMSVRR